MSDKRIIEYDAATAARTDDNILMDSPAVGTRKITKANFLADVYTAFQTIGNSITDINTFIGNETLQTEANTITGAINEILNNAATAIELTQAEYDALVLADEDKENVPYYISDAQSPAQIGLWAKVGSDELNVGDDLSDAVNELDNSVRTIKSNLTDLESEVDDKLKLTVIRSVATWNVGSSYTFTQEDWDKYTEFHVFISHANVANPSYYEVVFNKYFYTVQRIVGYGGTSGNNYVQMSGDATNKRLTLNAAVNASTAYNPLIGIYGR